MKYDTLWAFIKGAPLMIVGQAIWILSLRISEMISATIRARRFREEELCNVTPAYPLAKRTKDSLIVLTPLVAGLLTMCPLLVIST